MKAEAVLPIPVEPLPPSPQPPVPAGGGAQFSTLLNRAQSSTSSSQANGATSSASGNPTVQPSASASSGASGSPGKTAPSSSNNKVDSADGTPVAAVIALPVPVPLVVPVTPTSAQAAAAQALPAPSVGTAVAGQIGTDGTPASNAASTLASAVAAATGTALPTQNLGATSPQLAAAIAAATQGSPQNAAALKPAAIAANAATTTPGTAPAAAAVVVGPAAAPALVPAAAPATPPTLPSAANDLGGRVAAGAQNLASQPHVALAALVPGQEKIGTDTTISIHETSTPDPSHDLSKTTIGASSDAAGKLIPATVKVGATVTSLLANATPAESGAAAGDVSATVSDASTVSAQPLAAAQPQAPSSTPILDGTPSASQPLPPPPVVEQVAIGLRQLATNGTDHIQIQLQPADLGAIQVKLNVSHEGRVEVVVSAARSDTLNLLQQDSSNLTQALRDAGLQADSSSLSFNLQGGNQSNQQATTNGAAPTVATAEDTSDDLGTLLPTGPALRAHAGSVDIHV